LAFAQDIGLLVAGGLNGVALLWGVRQPNPVPVPLQLPGLGINSVAFSHGRDKIALGTYDGAVRLWDLRQQATPAVLHGHQLEVNSVAFSPDGELLASGGLGMVRLSIVSTEKLADMVPRKVWCNLTLDEWHQFVGEDIPYERT